MNRLFTREEADLTLPLVKRIVADILETAQEIREREEDDAGMALLHDRLQHHMLELEEIGCFYKDWNFEIGLVDFPAILDGSTVFLCWRSDEPELEWYHPIEEGYRGRRPLPKA